MLTRRRLARFAAVLLATPALGARGLAPAGATVLLTLSGKLEHPNAGALAHFDRAMLEGLPQHSYSARTPWYGMKRKFTGPLLRDVLGAAGARGSVLRCTALNNYVVDIPFQDIQQHPVLLVLLLDDKPIGVREKGPLFIVYPFHTTAALRNAVYYSRSAWQLTGIQVL